MYLHAEANGLVGRDLWRPFNSIMTEARIKELISGGEWVSVAPEVRPSLDRAAAGAIKPLHLTRVFSCEAGGRFSLVVTTLADPYGKVPVARMSIAGQMAWRGEHPIAPGAQKVDFTADEGYSVTPLVQPFADLLNGATKGFATWKVGEPQGILKRAFAPFGLVEGQVFKEFDLIHLRDGMMFWGARHVDGRGFGTEEDRPTNLQIPLVRRS